MSPFDLAVIGGGEAGIAAAITASELGAKAEDFIHLYYNHPSISEGFREAAANALEQSRG